MLTLNSRTVQPYLAHKKLAPFDIAHTSPTSPVLFAAFAVPVEDFVIGADWRVKWWGEREEQALSAGIVYEHEGARGKGLATFAGSAAPAPDWDKARPRVMGKIRTGNAPLQLQLVIRTSSSHLALRDDPALALFELVIHPQTSPNPELASLKPATLYTPQTSRPARGGGRRLAAGAGDGCGTFSTRGRGRFAGRRVARREALG